MSFTGNFIDAKTAEKWGLVNRIVPDEQLLETALQLANDIASADPLAVREIKQLIDQGYEGTLEDGLVAEGKRSQEWAKMMDPAEMENRRKKVQERGRKQ